MTIPDGLILFFSGIQAISFLFTSLVAWKIYQRQKMDAEENHQRDARIRLTQAWYQFDSEVLHSSPIIKNISSKR
jgi:hypothetical protein